jgi:nitroimidazol reductase NimA-like FMN-containing flavoprotein (pyridoxamine 5'-phosphate oxidase superfamily)
MRIPETEPVTSMNEQECWDRLSGVTLGRLATSIDSRPDIFPVNFVIQRRTVLIRTAEGAKLVGVSINPWVAFEADDHDVMHGWSIVVHGHAAVLESVADIALAEKAQVLPWTATSKTRFIRIEATRISGRRFTFGAEPDPTPGFG